MTLSKKIFLLLILPALFINAAHSQTINWASLGKEQRHIAHAHAGFDYAFVYGVGYSRQLLSPIPILATIDFSTPVGNKVLDDFKTKIGGVADLCEFNNFHLSASVYGIYRRYENPMAVLQNFGSEFKGVFGFYQSKWFVAAEFGFDKAIVTHFEHSDAFKENYPEVKNGWYQPATGGNFSYGVQTGLSFDGVDALFRIGKVVTQDFKSSPTIPFYAEFGTNIKINR
ncbi:MULTISPECIES: hypothetical protein [unclassified Imperialibacter]|uniref:hypothetical protein n=1 Tax=unclassified Imperialibacter TaxID=2629706 RepID=UPI0012577F15|nr:MULTISPECIES: hypothetical protein [unclassified Imperialibacter]CAD5255154.1 conserved exported hypothetical protein [Imperialibacter sp. 89]CAD5256484.1 conserved exported hypothetical protein [Imperialibacter sp. 75]VVT20156.1 conserved exported hypothetical protein [Imperialibacter sp. EC-SDR9]